MAQKCAICGVEMNILQSQKLDDGNYICRKTCKKLGLNLFDYAHSNLNQVKAHNAQVERGAKQWEHFFVPHLKTKNLKVFKPAIYVAEEVGLVALKQNRYKFLFIGKTEQFCVFRIADLYSYSIGKKTNIQIGGSKSSSDKEFFINFYFRNVEGLKLFKIKFSESRCKKIGMYFNSLFGIESKNWWQQQKDAAKGITASIKALATGNIASIDVARMKSDEEIEELLKKMGQFSEEGDRAQWIERADAALKA